ncbi:MAG: hypothetical protein N2C14_01025, partial [Planctomycetales bacterium]
RSEFPQADYSPRVRVVKPTADGPEPVPVDAAPIEEGSEQLVVSLSSQDVAHSGVYELRLSKLEGGQELRKFAYNVQSEEGDLKTVGRRRLAVAMEDDVASVFSADALGESNVDQAKFKLVEYILYALILLMLLEQVFAYLLTYHPPARAGNP